MGGSRLKHLFIDIKHNKKPTTILKKNINIIRINQILPNIFSHKTSLSLPIKKIRRLACVEAVTARGASDIKIHSGHIDRGPTLKSPQLIRRAAVPNIFPAWSAHIYQGKGGQGRGTARMVYAFSPWTFSMEKTTNFYTFPFLFFFVGSGGFDVQGAVFVVCV